MPLKSTSSSNLLAAADYSHYFPPAASSISLTAMDPVSGSLQRLYLALPCQTHGYGMRSNHNCLAKFLSVSPVAEVLEVEVQCMNLPVNMAMLIIFKTEWTNVFGWSWSSCTYWTLSSLWTCLRGMSPKCGNADNMYANKPRRTSPSTIG